MTTIAVEDATLQAFNKGKAIAVPLMGKIPRTDEFIIYLLELLKQEAKKHGN